MAQVEIDPDQDSDPIKASYDVFIKPHIAADRQIYILQFPNRDSKQHYTARTASQDADQAQRWHGRARRTIRCMAEL